MEQIELTDNEIKALRWYWRQLDPPQRGKIFDAYIQSMYTPLDPSRAPAGRRYLVKTFDELLGPGNVDASQGHRVEESPLGSWDNPIRVQLNSADFNDGDMFSTKETEACDANGRVIGTIGGPDMFFIAVKPKP